MGLFKVGFVEREFTADFSGTKMTSTNAAAETAAEAIKTAEASGTRNDTLLCYCIRCCRREERRKRGRLEHLVPSSLQKC